MRFDTKIVVVLSNDIETWQKLNVTAFLVSGIAGTDPALCGEPYEDGSGNAYLPMFRQPVMVHETDPAKLKQVAAKARARNVRFALYTRDLFATGHDEANRAAVRAVAEPDLDLVGIAFRDDAKIADKVLKGVPLHP